MLPKPANPTPMLRHYLEVKAQHPDALLFYRMGDFFELFFEDAQRAAPLLEVALTARGRGTDNETPMCGVPYHALEAYVGKVLRAGLKVAVCDQMEDPATAKGLVKREVTRVISPGTFTDAAYLDAKEPAFLMAVLPSDPKASPLVGAALLDVST
ncbi:MAG TPA: DNA mismatch repair protein MutS, partial [Thermoanaerobaculia bacterium]|nr:DNA mismatch repair protein MutS [Thermoanaerobaculia bacterium]